MLNRIIVILFLVMSFPPAMAQSSLVGRWQGEHAECVENVARLWLNNPADPEISSIGIRTSTRW